MSTGSVEWLLTDEASGVVVKVTGTIDADGLITLNYELLAGEADLNGLFIDYGNDGGSITSVGSKANNMKGSDNDGDKLDGFDDAAALGSIGGNDANNTVGTVTFQAPPGMTLEELAKAEIGIRATSVGEDGEGSLKLADTGTYCPPEEDDDDFPEWGQDISNIILVFDQTEGDEKPNPDGDGYYTVKIDNYPDAASDDLDDDIDAILAWLIENDPNISSDDDLLGVIIKGGNQDTNFFAYGDNNTNGTAPDTPPDGLGLSWEGSENPSPASATDQSYNYGDVFDFV